ncbi:hypothetical protein [Sneathiella glossodoripedis]|uniref:hypothetical protein n=1 Tax=Sneathiella glossodoripedis TaxID=418853 RepID=UPI000470DDE8|nr:hypothetical protein [Sneathiella glossodoripedis]
MTTNQEAIDILDELYQSLDDAYWASSDPKDRDLIRGISSSIYKEISALNKLEIENRSKEYEVLTFDVVRVNKKLEKLKKEIDDIIEKVDLAADVVKSIGKALGFIGKFI